MQIKIGILHSTIRKEEKLLIEAAKKRKVEVKLIDIRKEIFNPDNYLVDMDLVLDRSVSTVKGLQALLFFENLGVLTVNRYSVASLCADKFATSLVLYKKGVPIPKFALVFSEEEALKAIEELGGFPVVIKPTQGSWGRLLAKVNDRESLEAILEHKQVLGSPLHHSFYIQEYIKKPGRDIRAFVIDEEVICAIYRNSPHWITNTARGGKVSKYSITQELAKICSQASKAVGGGVLGIDIFETEEGLKVNEINHATEFRNSEGPTGVSISGKIIDYCLNLIKKKTWDKK
jgi:[lysine-biosynthesis-protein LysW]--L-2-aminoadipate ligase